jgi:hypothetical protein
MYLTVSRKVCHKLEGRPLLYMKAIDRGTLSTSSPIIGYTGTYPIVLYFHRDAIVTLKLQ